MSQLTLGSIAPVSRAEAAARAELAAASILCSTTALSADASAPVPRPAHRHVGAVAGMELALELPAILLPDAAVVPAASSGPAASCVLLPTARAPPLPFLSPVQARAPPIAS